MTELNDLPKEIIDILNKYYYLDLSSSQLWDSILKDIAFSQHEPIQNSIEITVLLGIQNITNFIIYAKKMLEIHEKEWLLDVHQINFTKKYFLIIIYLINIDKSANFKSKEITNFDNIINILLSHNFLELKDDENQYAIIFEMIILPFLFKNIADLIQVLNHHSAQELLANNLRQFLSEKISTYIVSHPFEWMLDLKTKKYFSDMINILSIILFLKRSFFHSGTHKTYGYYQRILDHDSANVFYSIPYNKSTFLLRGSSALFAGEANIDEIEIIQNKKVLIDFRYGLFLDSESTARAALNAALLLNDYFSDCLLGTDRNFSLLPYTLFLEGHSDNPNFSEQVYEQLGFLNPKYKEHTKTIPNIKSAPNFEKNRYLLNIDTKISEDFKENIIKKINQLRKHSSLHLTDRAFENVVLVKINKDETLVHEGDPALFVYIPTATGLEGMTTNNIRFFPQPWSPIGHIGVIQKDVRTATIVAKEPLELLMIPGTVYMMYWHIDYIESEFKELITSL